MAIPGEPLVASLVLLLQHCSSPRPSSCSQECITSPRKHKMLIYLTCFGLFLNLIEFPISLWVFF